MPRSKANAKQTEKAFNLPKRILPHRRFPERPLQSPLESRIPLKREDPDQEVPPSERSKSSRNQLTCSSREPHSKEEVLFPLKISSSSCRWVRQSQSPGVEPSRQIRRIQIPATGIASHPRSYWSCSCEFVRRRLPLHNSCQENDPVRQRPHSGEKNQRRRFLILSTIIF